jgi:hypothetical protein
MRKMQSWCGFDPSPVTASRRLLQTRATLVRPPARRFSRLGERTLAQGQGPCLGGHGRLAQLMLAARS